MSLIKFDNIIDQEIDYELEQKDAIDKKENPSWDGVGLELKSATPSAIRKGLCMVQNEG